MVKLQKVNNSAVSPLPLFLHMICGGGLPEKTKKLTLLEKFDFTKTKGHPYYTPKLQASAQRLFSRCCLLLAGSKISLSPLLPVSILIDSFFPVGSPLVVLHFVILRFSLPFSDSRDLTLISDFNSYVSSRFFWAAIWLVQLSLLEAPAVVRLRTPRLPISHSQIWFGFHFPFLHLSFYP